jgi:hypothetical protein
MVQPWSSARPALSGQWHGADLHGMRKAAGCVERAGVKLGEGADGGLCSRPVAPSLCVRGDDGKCAT